MVSVNNLALRVSALGARRFKVDVQRPGIPTCEFSPRSGLCWYCGILNTRASTQALPAVRERDNPVNTSVSVWLGRIGVGVGWEASVAVLPQQPYSH